TRADQRLERSGSTTPSGLGLVPFLGSGVVTQGPEMVSVTKDVLTTTTSINSPYHNADRDKSIPRGTQPPTTTTHRHRQEHTHGRPRAHTHTHTHTHTQAHTE